AEGYHYSGRSFCVPWLQNSGGCAFAIWRGCGRKADGLQALRRQQARTDCETSLARRSSGLVLSRLRAGGEEVISWACLVCSAETITRNNPLRVDYLPLEVW